MNSSGPGPATTEAVPPTLGTPAAPAPSATSPAKPNTEADCLEKVMPEIKELAQKVGGYDKLADLAKQLDRGD